jgi:hypothetical protein
MNKNVGLINQAPTKYRSSAKKIQIKPLQNTNKAQQNIDQALKI